MSRLARVISNTGIYHIVFRGVNKQHIFEERKDYEKFLNILYMLKTEMQFKIYVYCCMSNHVHMILHEKNPGDISLIMKRLLTKYARWYNIKYQRSGALIANRYKSQPIELDEYFLSVVRYIHQNPLKAGIVDDLADYEWSSYREYAHNTDFLADKSLVYDILPQKEFAEFHSFIEAEIFEVSDKTKLTDEGIRRQIIKEFDIEPKLITSFDKETRNFYLRQFKEKYSIRQIERITGISRGVIYKS